MKTLVLTLFVLAMIPVSLNAQSDDNYKHQTGNRKKVKDEKVITVSEEKENYKQTFSSEKANSSEKGLVKARSKKKSYKHQVPLKRN